MYGVLKYDYDTHINKERVAQGAETVAVAGLVVIGLYAVVKIGTSMETIITFISGDQLKIACKSIAI